MSNTVPRPKLRAHADSITAVSVEDEPLFYPRPASRHRVRWGLITTGMLTILLPLLLCQFTVLPWFSSLWGRFQHGDLPTYQVDQPLDGIQTHFVATNWHRRIDIIEYMGEGGRVVVYSGQVTRIAWLCNLCARAASCTCFYMLTGCKPQSLFTSGKGCSKL